ncbi:MAG: Gfo/Idh/MocA family oxidoreductase [Clostridia bacterium]|nr:Gfo/Idh/MocA family oxidoreductase [Clostridia bacterium]
MKIGLVGIGGMGFVHFNSYKNIEDAQLVAVCDVDVETLNQKTEGFDLNRYTDLDEMLANEELDMVDICTPTYLHMEQVLKALDKGVNVLCEKPMAMNSQETKIILDKVEETGKLYMVAHVIRFMANYKYLKSLIDTKKYGKLIRLDAKRISSIPRWSWENWFQDEKKSGLVVHDMVIHDIDFIQYTLGMPKDIVGAYYTLEGENNYGAATYLYDGFSASVETGWYNAEMPFMVEFFAVFENGYLSLKDGKLVECGEEIDLEKSEVIEETEINVSSADGYTEEIRYFMDCIKKGEKPQLVEPESSALTIKLIEMTLDKMTKLN